MGKKIDGLLKLREWGFPIRDFEIVKSPEDIKWNNEHLNYKGWVLRTDVEGDRKFALPTFIHVPKEEICKRITELREKYGDEMKFMVLPGHGMKRSGNIMILKDKIVIEVVKGMYSLIGTDGKLDAHYSFLRDIDHPEVHPLLERIHGDASTLSNAELSHLLRMARKVPEYNVVLEWCVSERDDFIFFDMYRIKG